MAAQTLESQAKKKEISVWDFMESLPEPAWEEHTVHLYRKDPKVSTVDGVSGTYTALYRRPITLEEIKKCTGAGCGG